MRSALSPYALRNVCLRVGANERVGILGRTGAGKSSLFSALFRLAELESGAIYVDNIDIANISLHRLRYGRSLSAQDQVRAQSVDTGLGAGAVSLHTQNQDYKINDLRYY